MTGVDVALAVGVIAGLVLSLLAIRRVGDLGRQLRRRPPPLAEAPAAGALQRVGMVRFRAYNDVGGDHSFALALLDGAGNGIVLLSLYHRERCRVYAKPVRGWVAAVAMTEEEQLALDRARSGEETVDMLPDGQ